jgi:hypothetical protein
MEDDGFNAQESVKLYNDLLIEEIENHFPESSDVDIKFDSMTSASCEGYGWTVPAPKIERWIESVANRLYKTPDRWLVKKGDSVESESI